MEDFLEHYGIKGMRWGVRRTNPSGGPAPVEVAAKPGRRVQTRGGQGYGPSDDAVRAAVVRRKARSSTTDSLTNQELRAAVERMNLEQQYDRLRPRRPSEHVTKFISDTLLNVGKDQATKVGRDYVGDLIKSK